MDTENLEIEKYETLKNFMSGVKLVAIILLFITIGCSSHTFKIRNTKVYDKEKNIYRHTDFTCYDKTDNARTLTSLFFGISLFYNDEMMSSVGIKCNEYSKNKD